MKIGTIDIGTNSMRLLIADYKNNKIENRKKYINKKQLLDLAKPFMKTDYGKYLVKIANENLEDAFEETRGLVELI